MAHGLALGGAPVWALLVVHAAHVDGSQLWQARQAGQRRGDLQEDNTSAGVSWAVSCEVQPGEAYLQSHAQLDVQLSELHAGRLVPSMKSS